tara:strand:- start:387 stop:1529 length:1143 start_codon:yes stop_codon:yes gene_type:complete
MKINIKEKKQDQWLFSMVIFLVGFGLAILFSASSVKSLELTDGASSVYYFLRQSMKVVPAILLFLFMSYFNYKNFQKLRLPWLLIGVSFFLLLYTKFQGCDGDACRWISIGPISFQTSDFARFSVIIFLADYIDRHYKNMDQFFTGIVFPVLVILPIALLIMIQPDNSTTIILMGIVFSMLFIGGAKLMQFFTTILLGASSMLIFIINEKSYVLKRIISFINPSISEEGAYQSTQSLVALQQGGFLGRGWGDSVQKHQYLPEPHTDFIFAVVGEELGFIAGIIIMFAYIVIFYRVIQIAKNSNDIFGIILSIGFGLSITYYAFVNIGVVINVIPVTGVTLPFISYGGSSLITNLLMVGILLNISKAQRKLRVRDWRLRVN